MSGLFPCRLLLCLLNSHGGTSARCGSGDRPWFPLEAPGASLLTASSSSTTPAAGAHSLSTSQSMHFSPTVMMFLGDWYSAEKELTMPQGSGRDPA